MSSATLILAIVGAVTGMVSLFWNIVRWHREQPRVKVRADLRTDGKDRLLTLRVTNPTATRIRIKSIGYRLHNGQFINCDQRTWESWRVHYEMPRWLEAHDAIDIGLSLSVFFDKLDKLNPSETHPRPYALDMTGKWYYGKTTKANLSEWRSALATA